MTFLQITAICARARGGARKSLLFELSNSDLSTSNVDIQDTSNCDLGASNGHVSDSSNLDLLPTNHSFSLIANFRIWG